MQYQAKEITSRIRENFIYEPGSTIPKALHKLLTEWSPDKRVFFERTTVTEKYVIEPARLDEDKQSLELLYRILKRDLDKVVGALIIGQPIIVISDDPLLIANFIAPLNIFSPHRLLKVAEYTEIFINPRNFDIIGIPRALINSYTVDSFSKCTIVDLGNERVLQGKSVPYIRSLLKKVRSFPPAKAKEHIQREVKQSVLKSIELVNACLDPEKGKNVILSMQKSMTRNEFNLVKEMALFLNPAAKSLEGFQGRLEKAITKLDDF